MQNRWSKDIASLGIGSKFRLYGAEYLILEIKERNVRLECTSIINQSPHSLLKIGAKLYKTSPLSVYDDNAFEVLSIADVKKVARKPITLGEGFVLLGSEEDKYKGAPLSKVAARKKR